MFFADFDNIGAEQANSAVFGVFLGGVAYCCFMGVKSA